MAPALKETGLYTEEDYYDLPEEVHAELIDGRLYDLAAPGRIHQEILSFLHLEIGSHIRDGKGACKVYPAPFAVRLFGDDRTVVEPDISVICDPGKLTDRGCDGSPDWIIEIVSPGNAGHDYVRKLNLYLDAGVGEYWIVDPAKGQIFVYHLTEPGVDVDTYTFRDKVKAGIYEDLWIDFSKITFS